MIASILANANRDRKKRSRPYTLSDFMPKAAGSSSRQTPEQMAAILRSVASGGSKGRRAR